MIYRPPSMGPPDTPPPSHWTMANGNRIQLVKTFKYVGGLTSCDGSQAPAISRRISTASYAFRNLRPVLKAFSGADMATRRTLYNTYVLPALTYSAAETWALTDQQWNTFSAVHNSFLRQLAGVRLGPDCISNQELYRVTGAPPLRRHIAQCRMRYLGHLARMPPGSLPRDMLMACGIQGLPPPGGGRRRLQRLSQAVTSVNRLETDPPIDTSQLVQLAQDRARWRELVQKISD